MTISSDENKKPLISFYHKNIFDRKDTLKDIFSKYGQILRIYAYAGPNFILILPKVLEEQFEA